MNHFNWMVALYNICEPESLLSRNIFISQLGNFMGPDMETCVGLKHKRNQNILILRVSPRRCQTVQKNCLLWDQLKGVERRISFTWRPFQNIFTAFHSKTDFGGRCARYQMPWITCHLLYSRGDVAVPGPKVNKFLLDVYFPIWSVTH